LFYISCRNPSLAFTTQTHTFAIRKGILIVTYCGVSFEMLLI
jgi:hypothetical protein